MNDVHSDLLVSCGRWFYQGAFALARFLAVEQAYGISLHRGTRRREAVLSLGGPEEGPARGRGSEGRRGTRRGARRG
jgi:hypothetical protein